MSSALRSGFVLTCFALLLACDKSAPAPPAAPTTPAAPTAKALMPQAAQTKILAKSSNAFAFDLYGKVRSGPGNLAMSPASISAALAMTFGGARAATEEQMKRVLHLEGSRETVMSDWGALARALQDPGRPLKLRIANRLFGEKTYKLEQPYLEQTKAAYGAALEPVDFKTAFEPARTHINGWVEDQTEHRIKDLLPLGALDKLTRLVLVNAIYFLADWADPFDKSSTGDETFTVAGGAQKKTPMMRRSGGYKVAQADGVQILELPYKGDDTAMLVVLPESKDGLADVEQSLSSAKLDAWTAALASKNVLVTLPRFEVSPSPSMSLGDLLMALGMTDAFDRDKADFTGIATPSDPRERLKISKVFHKAFVKVDEKGTEAAAATAVVAAAGGGPPAKPFEFRVDHPFLFFIVDKPSGLILFVGRVNDPTLK
jgi:serpin B